MTTDVQITVGGSLHSTEGSEIVTVFNFQPTGAQGLMKAVSSLTGRRSQNGNIVAITKAKPINKVPPKTFSQKQRQKQISNIGVVESEEVQINTTSRKNQSGYAAEKEKETRSDQALESESVTEAVPNKESFMEAVQLSERVDKEAETIVRKSLRVKTAEQKRKEKEDSIHENAAKQKKFARFKRCRVSARSRRTHSRKTLEKSQANTDVCDGSDEGVHDSDSDVNKTKRLRTSDSETRRHSRKTSAETGVRKFHQCPQCSVKFERFSHLEQHRKIHSGEFPYACDVCFLGFKTKHGCLQHFSQHTGDKPHKCPTCAKSFRQLTGLQQHVQTHDVVKKHQCTSCDASFRTNTHLKVHMRMHTGEKPYACKLCPDKFYRDLSSMRRHNLRIHGHAHVQYTVVKS